MFLRERGLCLWREEGGGHLADILRRNSVSSYVALSTLHLPHLVAEQKQ